MQITVCEKRGWKTLRNLYEKKFSKRTDKVHWIFRGEKCRKRDSKKRNVSDLQTSLDKAFRRFNPDKYKRCDLEKHLLREFQRKAYHHLPYVPKENNTIEWLTFMQHYGGPTRLLDWTYSFYAALFFAMARLDCKNEYGELWITNVNWLTKNNNQRFTKNKELKNLKSKRLKDAKHMDEYHDAILKELISNPKPLVVHVNAFNLNDRLIIQQGTFLMQGHIDKSFGENLKAMRTPKQLKENTCRIVINVDESERNTILEELNAMRINNATLFPGLQGFAESLTTQLAYPGIFYVDR